jgi:hypothetical protein
MNIKVCSEFEKYSQKSNTRGFWIKNKRKLKKVKLEKLKRKHEKKPKKIVNQKKPGRKLLKGS